MTILPDAGPLASAIEDTAWIDEPGIAWRSGRFRPSPQGALHYRAGLEEIRVLLPSDMAQAVPKRRAEFLVGRLCAGLAVQAAAGPTGGGGPVGRAGRAPVWPAGYVGSISHSGDWVLAVASGRHRRLGLDYEGWIPPDTAREIAPMILTDPDRAQHPPAWSLARYLTLVFSAKEAAYKALSAELPDMPEFQEAHIAWLGGDRLGLRLRAHEITVRYRHLQDGCLTLAAEPR